MEQVDQSQQRAIDAGGEARLVLEDITVIIPTVGRPILEKCLQSIASGTVLPACLIVVDQGENPAVAGWLQPLDVLGLKTVHLRSAERSPASARNRGIEQVQTSFVAAIDDDCIAEKDWLQKMEGQLRQNPTVIVTGRLEPAGDGIPPTVVTSAVPCLYTRPSVRVHSPLATANMGCALSTALRIGPFDGHVSPAEDNDWAYRALKMGIPILYAPELVVYHFHWRDKAQLAAVYRAYAWSQGAFYGKHLRRGDWSMLLRTGFSLFRGMRSLVSGIWEKDYGRRANGYARLTLLVPGLVAGLRGWGRFNSH
jgi:glycosyltransferase involved in cell wall biosynthesis